MSVGILEPLESRLTGRLAGRLAGHVQSTNLSWPAQVVFWMGLVDLCRELDDGLMTAAFESKEAVALHRAVVSLGEGCGSWLIHQIRTYRADISASGYTIETLEPPLNYCEFSIAAGIPISPPPRSRRRGCGSSMPRPEYIARLRGAPYELRTCDTAQRPEMLERYRLVLAEAGRLANCSEALLQAAVAADYTSWVKQEHLPRIDRKSGVQ